MLLVIDCGNTNTVFALVDKENIKASWRTATDSKKTADDYIVWLAQLMALENYSVKNINAVAIASVVPQSLLNLKILAKKYFACNPFIIDRHHITRDIKITLPNPDEIGADRLVNVVAARQKYSLPLIVVDFGTATTFDILNDHAEYIGGLIIPGVNLSLEALYKNAAKLPKVEIIKPEKVIGHTTIHAMQSGIYWGYLSLIEGVTQKIIEEQKFKNLSIIATGGLSTLFSKTHIFTAIDPDLTLNGLVYIYEAYK
ncbi:MAG: type III pantothenate kinase [Alphaproteobacteria bacterium]|nr:type III pantothenate kinase [Alphaproteobacteria bacterium]